MKQIIFFILIITNFCCNRTAIKEENISALDNKTSKECEISENIDIDSLIFSMKRKEIEIKNLAPIVKVTDKELKEGKGGGKEILINYRIPIHISIYKTKDSVIRTTSLSSKSLNKISYELFSNVNFELDELVIDYSESKYFEINENKNDFLLIISHPMNFVGKMTNYSFFELIEIKSNKLYQFFNNTDSPYTIGEVKINTPPNVYKIQSDYSTENDSIVSVLEYIDLSSKKTNLDFKIGNQICKKIKLYNW